MTADEFTETRKRLGLNQQQMGDAIGLSLRAVQEVESGRSPVRKMHVLALERLSLDAAVEASNPMVALPAVRNAALKLAAILAG